MAARTAFVVAGCGVSTFSLSVTGLPAPSRTIVLIPVPPMSMQSVRLSASMASYPPAGFSTCPPNW